MKYFFSNKLCSLLNIHLCWSGMLKVFGLDMKPRGVCFLWAGWKGDVPDLGTEFRCGLVKVVWLGASNNIKGFLPHCVLCTYDSHWLMLFVLSTYAKLQLSYFNEPVQRKWSWLTSTCPSLNKTLQETENEEMWRWNKPDSNSDCPFEHHSTPGVWSSHWFTWQINHI